MEILQESKILEEKEMLRLSREFIRQMHGSLDVLENGKIKVFLYEKTLTFRNIADTFVFVSEEFEYSLFF